MEQHLFGSTRTRSLMRHFRRLGGGAPARVLVSSGSLQGVGWVVTPLGIALCARMIVFVVADVAVRLVAPLRYDGALNSWSKKDAAWYLAIAHSGYSYSPTRVSSVNFFPLYPLLVHIFEPLLRPFAPHRSYLLAGMALSWVAFCLACVLLYRLALERFGAQTARGAVVLLAIFPFSFYYGAPFTESLYLLLCVAAFWAMERRWWWMACAMAMLAGAARPPGLVVGGCVALAYMVDWRHTRHALRWDVFALALTPLGVAAYMFYCWRRFGNPLAYIVASRAGWNGGHLQSGGLLMAWHVLLDPRINWIYTVYVVLFLVFLLSLVPILRLLGLGYALFAGASIIAPILDFPTVGSLGRYMSIVFPTFVVAAYALNRWPRAERIVYGVSLLAVCFFAAVFTAGMGLA